MIKLERCAPPVELTDEKILELTNLYLTEKKDVWKTPYIKNKLLEFSFGKCCYCECKNIYPEIEHFYPKKLYPEKVVVWDNLLLSCKRCNLAKREHDTATEPIIDPTNDDPKQHLYLSAYRFYAKTEIGKSTIEVVDLNDHTWLTFERFKVGEKVLEFLKDIQYLFEAHNHGQSLKSSRIRRKMFALLNESTPQWEYSATAATTLFSPENKFDEIKQRMLDLQLWDEEMGNLETKARTNCLFP